MITIYSKPNCMQCDYTKRWLEENKIPYQSIDVMQDDQALSDLQKHGFSGVPVVAVGGFDNAWSGFRPDRLAELVNDHDRR